MLEIMQLSVWTNCENNLLGRVLKLQKRAARLIMDADSKASSVRLFDDLSWFPFYEDIAPAYIARLLTRNNDLHSRNTRYANYNLVCPQYT